MKKLCLTFIYGFLIILVTNCKKSDGPHQQNCAELLTNGNFESDQPAFTTLYVHCNMSGCLDPGGDGKYAIGTDPKFFNSFFLPVQGNGKFMMVNGAGTSQVVWSETVNVNASSTYNLSFMFSVLSLSSPAKLNILINGNKVGTVDVVTDGQNWSKFNAVWSTGNTGGQAKIEIIDENTQIGGNDFALDEISFKKDCGK